MSAKDMFEKLDYDYYQCCDEMNKLKNAYSDYLEKQIEQLQQENQQLKEQLEQNTKINIADHKYASKCEDKVIELQDQLKQRDKVLDETIKMLDRLDTDIMQDTIIGFKQFIPRFYEIKEILQNTKEITNE